MQKLRQKKINDFIGTLNEREQKYMIKKINEKIYILRRKNYYGKVSFIITNTNELVEINC